MARRILTCDDVHALFGHLAVLEREVVAFAYLDADWRVLAMRHCLTGGTIGAATVPLRAVVRDAVQFGAVRVVMAHNHPSGDPTPSKADIATTRRIALALDALGAPLIEHLVLAGAARRSLAAAGPV